MNLPSAIPYSALLFIALISTASALDPLVRVVELDIGETAEVTLCDDSTATVKLVDIEDRHDSLSGAVRRSEVTIEINGERAQLTSATYHLPAAIAGVRIDCPITSSYLAKPNVNRWGLTDKAARLRLWPADSPVFTPGTFRHPVDQRWFGTATRMANEPTFVDGGDNPKRRKIYYHSGLEAIQHLQVRVEK